MKSNRLFTSLSITLAAIALMSTACSRNQGGKEAQPGSPAPASSPAPNLLQAPQDGSKPTPNADGADDGADGSGGSADSAGRSDVVHYDPTGMTPEQLRSASDALGPVLVGPKSDLRDFSGAELSYSGAGQDSLREIITAHVNSREEAQKQADADLVKRLKGATIDVDWNTRSMQIAVKLVRAGRTVEFKTGGQLTNALSMSTPVGTVPGDLSFEANCMDVAGGCKTVHLMIQETSATGARTAHVLVRKTSATWYLEANAADRHQNDEFNRLMEILWLPTNDRKVERIEMETVEIVGGTSNFVLKMLARKSAYATEWIMWSGPLVKPEASSDMNLMVDIANRGALNESIRDTRLTYNDGRGNLRINVTVRKLEEREREASLSLTFGRIHAPTRELRLK
ncbi:MAG: hypothetical protein V4760_15635 [Bdellovibrionota bacterium]